MIELTADLIGGSFLVLMVSYAVAFAFQLYMMYLNYKQSKVNNQMQELIKEVKEIKRLIRRK